MPYLTKILHLVDTLNVGGMEKMIAALAVQQKNAGKQPMVVTLLSEGPIATELRDFGVKVTNLAKPPGFHFPTIKQLRSLIQTERYHVLHTHNPVPLVYGAMAQVTNNACCLINSRHDMGQHLGSKKSSILYRIAARRADWTVAVCKPALERFIANKQFSAKNSVCISNGINLAPFLSIDESQRMAVRKSLGVEKNQILLGTVGRLNQVKAQTRMLDVCKVLKSTNIPVRMLLVGDGPEAENLRRYAQDLGLQDCVIFTGERNDIPDLLSAMDIFVMTSLTEGYSMALVEASAAKLPIVTNLVGGNSEIVQNEKTGFLVEEFDVKDFVNKIRILALRGDLRIDMGRAAREWATANGSMESMETAYDRLYQNYSSGAKT
jgi:glycosyltransferase involved in cell wall biosynthesis